MGLRQPTRVGAFFAQSKAGTQKQDEARKQLKKPQALGGAASAGTQMVANTTQAQGKETEQVKTETKGAATNIVADPMVGTQTTQVLTNVSGRAAPPPVTSTNVQGYVDAGNVTVVNDAATDIQRLIDETNKEMADLDARLKTANEADAKAIAAEKERLSKVLQDYRDKVTKGNLGQIAGPSAYETLMEEQLGLMATEGQDVGKLANIFGPRWNQERYGALESQIYGKDLEALGEQAAIAKGERARGLREAEAAMSGFQGQLGRSKKAFEEGLDKQSKVVEILKKPVTELAAYTRKELEDLFGKVNAEKIFDFSGTDPNSTVTNTASDQVRKALTDRVTALGTEKTRLTEEGKKAQDISYKKEADPIINSILGEVDSFTGQRRGGKIETYRNISKNQEDTYSKALSNMKKVEASRFSPQYKGWSKDKWAVEAKLRLVNEYKTAVTNLEQKMNQAITDKDMKTIKNIEAEFMKAADEYNRRNKELPKPSDRVFNI